MFHLEPTPTYSLKVKKYIVPAWVFDWLRPWPRGGSLDCLIASMIASMTRVLTKCGGSGGGVQLTWCPLLTSSKLSTLLKMWWLCEGVVMRLRILSPSVWSPMPTSRKASRHTKTTRPLPDPMPYSPIAKIKLTIHSAEIAFYVTAHPIQGLLKSGGEPRGKQTNRQTN